MGHLDDCDHVALLQVHNLAHGIHTNKRMHDNGVCARIVRDPRYFCADIRDVRDFAVVDYGQVGSVPDL